MYEYIINIICKNMHNMTNINENYLYMILIAPIITSLTQKIIEFLQYLFGQFTEMYLHYYEKFNSCKYIEIELYKKSHSNVNIWINKYLNDCLLQEYSDKIHGTGSGKFNNDFRTSSYILATGETTIRKRQPASKDEIKSIVKKAHIIYKTDIKLTEHIYTEIRESYCEYSAISTIICVLKSKNNDELQKFIINARKYNVLTNVNKILTFASYNTTTQQCLYLINDYTKTISFDNLFFKEKKTIINEINMLSNEKYYGIKNKCCFLFVGKCGVGKTSICLAIANMLNRCIISIPANKLSTDSLHHIIYGNTYDVFTLKNNQKIIFIDEIDSVNKVMKKHNAYDKDDHKKEKRLTTLQNSGDPQTVIDIMNGSQMKQDVISLNKEFDVGYFLSLLDGPYDQTGLIIIATANNIGSIDPGIYRNGRFNVINLENNDAELIAEMIEYYYKQKLTIKQKKQIRNDKIISNAELKDICIQSMLSGRTIDYLIGKINSIKDTSYLHEIEID